MTDWTALFGDLTVAQALLWIAAASGFVLLVVKFWRPLKALSDFMDDVKGEPARPGVPARPGLMERVGAIEEKLDTVAASSAEVRHEVLPNTGTSLNDAVHRTEGAVGKLTASVEALQEHVSTLQEDMGGVHKKLDNDHARVSVLEDANRRHHP